MFGIVYHLDFMGFSGILYPQWKLKSITQMNDLDINLPCQLYSVFTRAKEKKAVPNVAVFFPQMFRMRLIRILKRSTQTTASKRTKRFNDGNLILILDKQDTGQKTRPMLNWRWATLPVGLGLIFNYWNLIDEQLLRYEWYAIRQIVSQEYKVKARSVIPRNQWAITCSTGTIDW